MEFIVEEKILDVVCEVFMIKGFVVVCMQEIVDWVEINKGLLYYYYCSKNKFFWVVFDEVFVKFLVGINQVFEVDIFLFDKIEQFVDCYISLFMWNLVMLAFVISEFN